jgi:hypothetical protein
MDPDRESYEDRDLPPPRQLPPLHIVLGLLGVAMLAAMVTAACYLALVPKVRD